MAKPVAPPESLLAVALFLGGCFAVGWAGVIGWLGNASEAKPLLPGMIQRLLRLGFYAYLGAFIMMSVELALV